jgi:hypothetical protein
MQQSLWAKSSAQAFPVDNASATWYIPEHTIPADAAASGTALSTQGMIGYYKKLSERLRREN